MTLACIRICAVAVGLAALALGGYLDRDQDDLQVQADNTAAAPIEARAAARAEQRANRIHSTSKARP